MKLRMLAALLISVVSTQALAVNVDCKVEVGGKVVQAGVHKLAQIPDEGEGASVGVIYQDEKVQIVVSNYPLQVTINQMFGGHIIRSTESSRLIGVARMAVLEDRATTAARVGGVAYRVMCTK